MVFGPFKCVKSFYDWLLVKAEFEGRQVFLIRS